MCCVGTGEGGGRSGGGALSRHSQIDAARGRPGQNVRAAQVLMSFFVFCYKKKKDLCRLAVTDALGCFLSPDGGSQKGRTMTAGSAFTYEPRHKTMEHDNTPCRKWTCIVQFKKKEKVKYEFTFEMLDILLKTSRNSID